MNIEIIRNTLYKVKSSERGKMLISFFKTGGRGGIANAAAEQA